MARLHRCYQSTFGPAALGSLLWWAALPPVDLWPLAWLAPLGWILLIRRNRLDGRHPYRALWLAGFLFWLAAIHWLRLPHPATILGWIALSFYLAFYLPTFVALSRVAVHRLRIPVIIATPIVWMGLELARAHLLTGFSMGAIGHTQFRWLGLIQISDLAGAYAVDFVILLVAACAARMIPLEGRKPPLWPLLPAALVLAATLAYGQLRIEEGKNASQGPATRVALIQGSVDSQLKYDPSLQDAVQEQYQRLTQQALQQYGPVDLVVWPETMFRDAWVTFDANAAVPKDWTWSEAQFQTGLRHAAAVAPRALKAMAEQYRAALLVGIDAEHYGAHGITRTNSAIFVTRDGQPTARYDKIHRVLFGEYMPFVDWLPWLQHLTPVAGSVAAGARPVAIPLDHLRIAPSICYETVLAHVIRRQVSQLANAGQEPDVLVNLTNDGWFWGSSELDMHLACAVFRAVECRKPLLIAANTGISAWIDADGRILDRGPHRAEKTLLAEVRPDNRHSWYLHFGDWPAGLCLTACLALAATGLKEWLRARRNLPQKSPRSKTSP